MTLKFIQYVYHFDYPMDSFDVRKMNVEDIEFIKYIVDNYIKRKLAGHYYSPPAPLNLKDDKKYFLTEHNYKTAKRLLEQHYPEYLI